MNPQERGPEPEILIQMGSRWSAKFIARRTQKAAAKFYWPAMPMALRHSRLERLNNRLLPLLKAQSDGCCSFCNKRPVEVESVEHHAPKSRRPDLAYAWSNLFYCCGKCQGRKKEHYHPSLLKPDVEYRFEDYFTWEFKTGKIKVNPLATKDKQRAAKVTICLYALNDPEHCRGRFDDRENWKMIKELRRLRRTQSSAPAPMRSKAQLLETYNYPAFVTAADGATHT